MNKRKPIIILVILSMIIPFFVSANSQFDLNQVAYLKINNNRIFIYEYEGLPTDKDIAQYFLIDHKPMHTGGRFTAVYIWPKGNKKPLSGFNTINSIDKANEFLYNSPLIDNWEFAYMKGLSGDAHLVSCIKTQSHELCRK